MQKISSTFTVYYEAPYWVGVVERTENARLQVCKIIFGPEPTDPQIHQFLLENWNKLRFYTATESASETGRHKNPKRVQREITRRLHSQGVGTKSQQALKAQQQQGKQARKLQARAQRKTAEQQRFALRQQKKKEKKKGH